MLHLIKLTTMIINQSVQRLALEDPDWIPVLRAAVTVAERSEAFGGEFSGHSVVRELSARGGPRWINNLRLLASYGFVEKTDSSARRAYYRMPARVEISRALADLPPLETARGNALRFVAAGSSSAGTRDVGRRAGEIAFEPPSWR